MSRQTPTFASRLEKARKLRGLSSRELSTRAKLHPAHVAVIVSRPNSRVWPETAAALADVLGVEPSWLLFGTGEGPKKIADARSKRTKSTAGRAANGARRRS